ncbi:MAG: hypothetical protein MJA83_02825 [Gammaproteobacteria bacterium]|nr:hypothetical protein [Gammaproteobacteria bacterium]
MRIYISMLSFVMAVGLCLPGDAVSTEIGTNDFRVSFMGDDGDASIGVNSGSKIAVAHNTTDNQYLVVWSADDDNDNEFEIYAQRLDGTTGDRLGDSIKISDMGPDGDTNFVALNPDVVWNDTSKEYFVVWEGSDDEDGFDSDDIRIFGQRLSTDLEDVGSNDFDLTDPGTDRLDANDPAIAWNVTDNEYLLVWVGRQIRDVGSFSDQEADIILGRRIGVDGSKLGSDDEEISDFGFEADSDDVLTSEYANLDAVWNETEDNYLVVWEEEFTQTDAGLGNVEANRTEINGQLLDSVLDELQDNDFRINDTFDDPDFASNPAAVWNKTENEYLVVWSGERTDDALEIEILGQRLDKDTDEIGDDDFRISNLGPDDDDDFSGFEPFVVWNETDNQYLVTWYGDDDEDDLINDEFEVYVERLDKDGDRTGSSDERISDMGEDGDAVFDAFSPVAVWNSQVNEYLVVWFGDDDADNDLTDDEFEIYGQRLVFDPDDDDDSGDIDDDDDSGDADDDDDPPFSNGSWDWFMLFLLTSLTVFRGRQAK